MFHRFSVCLYMELADTWTRSNRDYQSDTAVFWSFAQKAKQG